MIYIPIRIKWQSERQTRMRTRSPMAAVFFPSPTLINSFQLQWYWPLSVWINLYLSLWVTHERLSLGFSYTAAPYFSHSYAAEAKLVSCDRNQPRSRLSHRPKINSRYVRMEFFWKLEVDETPRTSNRSWSVGIVTWPLAKRTTMTYRHCLALVSPIKETNNPHTNQNNGENSKNHTDSHVVEHKAKSGA